MLITTPSKALRAHIFQKIIAELRNANAKTTNHRLNATVQNLLNNLLTSDRTSSKGVWAVKITRELWRRQVWRNDKAAEIMKEAALAEHEKIILGGVRFFLGGDKEREEALEESSGEEEKIDMGKLRHQVGINKKTKKKQKDLKQAAATVRKKERKKNQPHPLNFSALHLLHDPQGFAEELFSKHLQSAKSRLKLDQKLEVLQLVSRLVGLHKLTIISLYSFFIKYLTPKQHSVTSFLASLAQSTHNLVPPDVLEPLIQKIANEFVSEAAAGEVASAGLNAIREICARQPLAMTDTLLQDLVLYRKSKDKGVMMAAKGLLSLYRDVGAELLKKRDRGKDATMNFSAGQHRELKFGEEPVGQIEGLDLLERWKEEERRKSRIERGLDPDASGDDEEEAAEEEAKGWENWDAEDDDSDDSGGWIDVVSDGEDIDISDSDDDKPAAKKQKPDRTLDAATPDTPATTNGTPAPDLISSQLQPTELSKLATTRFLTPADLAKLQELRLQQSVSAHMRGGKGHHAQKAAAQAAAAARHADDPLTAAEIEGLALLSKGKNSKEERIAIMTRDREEKHESTTAKRKNKKASEGKSTTNAEKARGKNFMMTLGKAKRKNKRSLRDVGKALRGHTDRMKRGGRRGNVG